MRSAHGRRPTERLAAIAAGLSRLVLGLLACGGCSDPLADECGGRRPALAECPRGLYFAECGGPEAIDRLACNQDGCLWFAGCVAEGYRPVECPLGDPCCEQSSDGPWPWSDGFGGSTRTRHDLAVLSHAPLTRSSPGIAVTIDPTVAPSSSVAVACTGELTFLVCGRSAVIARRYAAGDAWVLELWGDFFGDIVQLEIVPTVLGPTARVFVNYASDVMDDLATCDVPGPALSPAPALHGGSVTIDRSPTADPENVHGEATLELAGGTLLVRF